MVSAASQRAIEAAGLPFILGARIPAFPRSSPRGVTSTPAMPTAWEECPDKVGVA